MAGARRASDGEKPAGSRGEIRASVVAEKAGNGAGLNAPGME